MSDDEHGRLEVLSYTSSNSTALEARMGMRVTSGASGREALSNDLSVVAQLVEAACRARDGDREGTRAHIAHAVKLLQGMPSLGPIVAAAQSADDRQPAPVALPAWRSKQVVAYIEANLSRRILVGELAQLVGLSASHFCRAFKRTFGAPPRAYVLRRRIELAQGLMLTTCEPLSAIALRCGMCDQAHFTRSFRRIVAETPRSWRRTRRGAINSE